MKPRNTSFDGQRPSGDAGCISCSYRWALPIADVLSPFRALPVPTTKWARGEAPKYDSDGQRSSGDAGAIHVRTDGRCPSLTYFAPSGRYQFIQQNGQGVKPRNMIAMGNAHREMRGRYMFVPMGVAHRKTRGAFHVRTHRRCPSKNTRVQNISKQAQKKPRLRGNKLSI